MRCSGRIRSCEEGPPCCNWPVREHWIQQGSGRMRFTSSTLEWIHRSQTNQEGPWCLRQRDLATSQRKSMLWVPSKVEVSPLPALNAGTSRRSKLPRNNVDSSDSGASNAVAKRASNFLGAFTFPARMLETSGAAELKSASPPNFELKRPYNSKLWTPSNANVLCNAMP